MTILSVGQGPPSNRSVVDVILEGWVTKQCLNAFYRISGPTINLLLREQIVLFADITRNGARDYMMKFGATGERVNILQPRSLIFE